MMNEEDMEIIQKLNDGINLSESELSYLQEYSVKDIEGDDGRWSRFVSSIIEFNNQTYILEWEKGLTEYQENSFHYQPRKVKIEKTIKVVTMEVTNYIDEKTGKIIEYVERKINDE